MSSCRALESHSIGALSPKPFLVSLRLVNWATMAPRRRRQRLWGSMLLRMCFLLLLMMSAGNCEVAGSPSQDRIFKLPGQPDVSFAQFSGFVTVNHDHGSALFYYLTEAVTNAISKPLVLWLNGGPGCSSVGGGGFTELGPFFPNGYGDGLIANNYSWNLLANLLFLESPAGVGFSYTDTPTDIDSWDDAKVAEDSLVFLLNWLDRFPRYKSRDFYIAGESYAGHYIPDLAALIVDYNNKTPRNHKINLKGLIMGNSLFNLGVDSQSTYDFLWSHGLLSEQTHASLNANCNWDNYRQTLACVQAQRKSQEEVDLNYLNPYNVIVDVCLPAAARQELTLLRQMTKSKSTTADGFEEIKQISLGVDVCIDEEEDIYFNLPEVQRAFHVPGPVKWIRCSNRIEDGYKVSDVNRNMMPILADLVESGVRLLIYSGDQDSVVPLIGTRQLILALANDLRLKASTSYKTWIVDRQIAGWFQVFGHNNDITYVTVRGASHMVPLSQPTRALQLFQSFLANEQLPTRHPRRNLASPA